MVGYRIRVTRRIKRYMGVADGLGFYEQFSYVVVASNLTVRASPQHSLSLHNAAFGAGWSLWQNAKVITTNSLRCNIWMEQ